MTAPSDRALAQAVIELSTRCLASEVHTYSMIERRAREIDTQQPQQAEGELGYCCYGGMKLKRQCASCAAWNPQPGARVPDTRSYFWLASVLTTYGDKLSPSAMATIAASLGQQPAQGEVSDDFADAVAVRYEQKVWPEQDIHRDFLKASINEALAAQAGDNS